MGKVASPAKATRAAADSIASPWPCIQALIEAGGQIMIGKVAPIAGAAIAHDGTKTLALLKRRPRETIHDLLARLDAAIAAAQSTGSRIDEINTPSSDRRYEL